MGREKEIFIEILQTYVLDCLDSIIEIKSDDTGTGASECKPDEWVNTGNRTADRCPYRCMNWQPATFCSEFCLPSTCNMAECLTGCPTPLFISHTYIPSSPFLTWLRWRPPGSNSVLFGGIVPPDLCHVTCGGGLPTALHSSVTFEPAYNIHLIKSGNTWVFGHIFWNSRLVIVSDSDSNTISSLNTACNTLSELFYFSAKNVTKLPHNSSAIIISASMNQKL